MKLHLPLFLRKSVLSCLALVAGYTLSSGSLAFADDLVLGTGDEFSVDYAEMDSIPNLENSTLQLQGDTLLQLLNCGSGDGKTYTLATGVSGLTDAQGNTISLDSSNNAISNYFDTSQFGTGFWAGGILQLVDGALQLVLHAEAVKDAVTITTQNTENVDYQYYAGVLFDNFASSAGGSAIYSDEGCPISLCNNGNVAFSGYSASAIFANSAGDIEITLNNNGSVEFIGNSISDSSNAIGGAIKYGMVTLSNNGSVIFEDNSAVCSSSSYSACGGAIYGSVADYISLSDNGSVIFRGNTAAGSSSACGGAICVDGGSLSIHNNDTVEFYQNAEVQNGFYRLRSIFAGGKNSRAGVWLSAAAGNTIIFRDSIFIDVPHFILNSGSGKGDIIFTGATTEDDLYIVKGNVAGTAAEISSSRTSEVYTMTNLLGGRLRVEDGAIYQGYGITAHAGSESTVLVKDATLSHAGYDLTFNAGTTLEVLGDSYVSGNIILNSATLSIGSCGAVIDSDLALDGEDTLRVDFSGPGAATSLNGSSLSLQGGTTLQLTNCGSGNGKTYTLFTDISALLGTKGALTLDSTNNAISNYFDATQPGTGFWADGTLVLSDDGTLQLVLHDQNVKEAVVISTRQTGGAKYQYYAGVSFENIQYNPTGGPALGGAVRESSVTLSDNGFVLFSGNKAEDDGGQFWRDGEACDSDVVCGNGSGWVSAYTIGGAICANNLTLNNNGRVEFIGNTATSDYVAHGGAVYGDTVTMSDNGSVKFIGNLVTSSNDALGGAIDGGTITLNGNGSVEFIDNKAFVTIYGQSRGGAIHGDWGVTLNDNGSVLFQNNGGAIYAALGAINLNNNGNVSFIENSGRAIYAASGAINLNNNGSVSFSGNAIYAAGGDINLNSNGSVSFSGGSGSAINTIYGAINLNNNGSVSFSGNTGTSGGAIYGAYDVSLNGNGRVSFIGNSVRGNEYTSEWYQSQGYYGVYGYGGAIYGEYGPVSLCDNGRVEFIGNNVSVSSSYPIYIYGGAICTFNDLNIRNNDSVEFYQNAEGRNGEYRLNSIVVGGYWSTVSLSAAEGKHITFRDSIYIDAGNTFNLNADYGSIKQKGDILFTGATTVDDLYIMKGNIAGTEEEILASRTSEVYTMTNLYGGRLRVEEGAIYQGYGITAHAGSASTVRVKDAELSHAGYDLTFNAGTTLELEGGNSISGNVQMLDDSTLRFIYATDTTLSMTGNLNFDGSATIELVGYGECNYKLISQNGGMLSGWDLDALRFMNGQGESLDASRFVWVASSLYFMNADIQSIVWTNATGDGLWNNVSENWDADGTPYASTILQNVILGAGGNETITMVGNQAVNTLTVQQNAQYMLQGNDAEVNLTVRENVELAENSALSLQGNLEAAAVTGGGALAVTGALKVIGGVTAGTLQVGTLSATSLTLTDAAATSTIGSSVSLSGAVNVAGGLSVSGSLAAASLQAGSLTASALTLTDAAASNAVGGDVSVSGALKTAGVLTVGGALKAGSLAGGSNELAVSGNITLGSMTGNSNVLTSGGSATTGAINGSHNSITAVTLVTTNGKALTGDYNTLEATAGQVFVQGQLKGNYNTLKGGKEPADGNTISVWSGINGNNNVLLAEEGTIAMGAGSLQGDSNSLTATEGAILVKDIQGAGNKLTAGTTISIGAISSTTAGNMLTAGANISTGAITGEGNVLSSTSGGITIGGAFKGDEGELSAKDEIVFNAGIGAEDASADYNRISSTDNIIRTANDKTTNGSHNIFIGNEVHLRGKVTGDYNTITATKRASDGNSLTIWNGLYGSNNTLTVEDGNIGNSGGLFGADNKLTTEKGNINFVNGTLGNASTCADRNILVAGGLITMGAISGSANELTAGTYIQTSSLTGDANTLTAGTYVNINGKLTGDSNDISSSGTDSGNANGIRIANGLEGDGNKLTAEAGRIVIGGGTSLNGSNNTLLAKGATSGGEGITLDGNLAGSGNKLTAETGNIKLGNITGDSNTLEAEAGTITASTINGTGNTLKGATVQVNGELKGSANTIEGNAVQVGTLSGSGHGITALAGNVTINSLNTTTGNTISTGASYGITVGSGSASNQTWTAGSLSVTGAAGLSLTDSTVTVSGTVESAKLNLGGASSLAAATLSVNSVSLLTDAAVSMTLETADVAELYLQAGATLDVNGTLNAGTVTMQLLTSSAPGLTVGQFAAGETIFCLDVEMVNALNLGHGESVVLARADQAISGDFSAWLTSAGNSSLDAAVYRYDISVSGAEVVLTMDYANWGTRVWYGNTWVGKESWSEYMVCGYDAVDGVETVDLGGSSIAADALYIAAGEDAFTTVMANGSMSAAYAEVDGKLTIAESCALEIGELAAGAQEVQLQGELTVDTGSIGKLSGTTGALVIVDELSVNSDVTLGSLDNSGTLDIGSHSLKVASAVTNGGSVVAGNVEVHNRMSGYAVFDKLVADKVNVTNTSNSSAYTGNLSVGDGSAIGELVAEKLQVRDGVVTLGRTDAATAQELQSIELQKGADLVLQGQTRLGVTDSVAMTTGSTVQIQSGASLQNGAVALSAAPGTAAAQLSSKTGGNLVEMQRDAQFSIHDMLLVNTSISAAEGTAVMLSGVEGSENLHLMGGADFSLTFADNKADVGMAVIENSSPVTGITLSAGSTLTLVMDPTNNDFRDYSLVINMSGFEYEGGSLAATGGITDLNAAGIYLGGWLGEMLAAQGVAQEGMGNLESPEVPGDSIPTVSYTYSTENNVGMIISIHGLSVPEPTTTTLSLLALCALAARRRRK